MHSELSKIEAMKCWLCFLVFEQLTRWAIWGWICVFRLQSMTLLESAYPSIFLEHKENQVNWLTWRGSADGSDYASCLSCFIWFRSPKAPLEIFVFQLRAKISVRWQHIDHVAWFSWFSLIVTSANNDLLDFSFRLSLPSSLWKCYHCGLGVNHQSSIASTLLQLMDLTVTKRQKLTLGNWLGYIW